MRVLSVRRWVKSTLPASAIEAALAHPLMARARAAARIHREYPVTLPLEQAGAILEGVIDLAFIENGAWVIVDFKDRWRCRFRVTCSAAVNIYCSSSGMDMRSNASPVCVAAKAYLLEV